MKKIIGGKVYDTATATCIGETEFGASGDHRYFHESLFKTRAGRYFLEFHGGAMSKYAVDQGPHLVGGSSGIRLLDNDEALGWCEEHDIDVDVVARFFDLEEG